LQGEEGGESFIPLFSCIRSEEKADSEVALAVLPQGKKERGRKEEKREKMSDELIFAAIMQELEKREKGFLFFASGSEGRKKRKKRGKISAGLSP